LGGWGQIDIKDHLSPAKLELGLSLAINTEEDGWILPKRTPNEQEVKTKVGLIIGNVILI